ncbi:MAG TPA: PRC-barrel domain-containing protein [Gemmatimonadaceae bacterium]|jgi:hypothetical protein
MDRNDRNGRDAAGIGPYARERETLTPLSSLDSWKVSDGEPDIRGWDVRTVSGKELGSVADLLVDADAGEVVLLDIDLPGTDRHTFVPIRVAQLDRERRVVLMDSADVPVVDLARADRSLSQNRRTPATGIVRYPDADREIIAERATLADAAPVDSDVVSREAAPRDAVERRSGDRRRIDRMSSDF